MKPFILDAELAGASSSRAAEWRNGKNYVERITFACLESLHRSLFTSVHVLELPVFGLIGAHVHNCASGVNTFLMNHHTWLSGY